MIDIEPLRKQFERLVKDSYGFKRSRKGSYTNPAVARDWKWFQIGVYAIMEELAMPQIPFAIQIPSLVNLRMKCRSQLPSRIPAAVADEIVTALAVLAQAAYEDYAEWATALPEPGCAPEPPPNPAEYKTVAGLAAAYASRQA